jgi:lysophospholipase L1-like esterase
MAYLPRQRYLFAPDDWDVGWRAALRASAASPVNIAVLGDSFAYGSGGVSDWNTKPWFSLFRAGLLTKYTQGGDFWHPGYSNEYQVQFGGTFLGTPQFSSLNATNRALSGGIGYVVGAWWTPTPVGNLWTFTTPYACTDIDIFTIDWSVGNFTYTVDGGATQTVTIASTTSPQTLRRTQITGLANTTHTVVCTGQSVGLGCLLLGCATYKSRTAGLRFGWTAINGATVGTYTSSAIPTQQYFVWQGRSGASPTGFGFPGQPDLAIIALGINDCVGGGVTGFALEGYQGALRRICQALRRGNANCSILFMANSNPDGDNSELTTGFSNAISWPMYVDRMLNIAIDYNAALVNFHSKWGELGVTNGFQTAADPHPTDAGHADIDTTLSAIL